MWPPLATVRDRQGSIIAVTDSAGFVEQVLSYDPWGAPRDPATGALYAADEAPEPMLLGRGYTGHEHLLPFALVNMNARLYDPATARFLSPDPIVQSLDGSQSFNRYAYGLNNPLLYIDPLGLFRRITPASPWWQDLPADELNGELIDEVVIGGQAPPSWRYKGGYFGDAPLTDGGGQRPNPNINPNTPLGPSGDRGGGGRFTGGRSGWDVASIAVNTFNSPSMSPL